MNLAAAAASSECQSALVESPAAARAAHAKHRASIIPELARALEKVGSYATNEVTFTQPRPLSPFSLPMRADVSHFKTISPIFFHSVPT